MTAELKSTSQGQTMILTLSNPALRNALEPQMYAAGVEALSVAESNPDVRSIVITGAGAVFSAGGNIHALHDNRSQPPSVQGQRVEGLHSWIEAIRTCPKPVIAAVQGAAAGAGFSLALACDFIVAERAASFVAAYSRLALSPDGGATWHLRRAVPRHLAARWLMLAEPVPAQRLYELGLVHSVCDNGEALAGALELAQRLNLCAANALASIKELLADAEHSTLNEQLGYEREHFVRNLHHANAGLAIDAFLAGKR